MTLEERMFVMPEGLDTLKVALEERWPEMQTALRASGVYLNDGEDGDGGDGEGGDGGEGDGSGGGSADGDGFQPITSQADFDRRIQERIARVKATPPADYEDLKAKAAKLAEFEEANKTELEKAQERAQQLERERDEAFARAKQSRLESAIVAEASKADRKIVDPQAVLKLIDRDALTLDDDGNPTNIAEAMDSLIEASPYLVGGGNGTTTTRVSADQGARSGGAAAGQLTSTEGMSSAEIAAAVADGRLDQYLKSTTQ